MGRGRGADRPVGLNVKEGWKEMVQNVIAFTGAGLAGVYLAVHLWMTDTCPSMHG